MGLEDLGSAFAPLTGLPWRVDIDPFMSPLASVGSWTASFSTSNLYGATIVNAAQNDSLDYLVVLTVGTWSLEMMYLSSTDRGIAKVQLDNGAGAFTTVGTIDTYSASLVRNVKTTLTGIAVGATIKRTMRILLDTKNASSSGYLLGLQRLTWRRTA